MGRDFEFFANFLLEFLQKSVENLQKAKKVQRIYEKNQKIHKERTQNATKFCYTHGQPQRREL